MGEQYEQFLRFSKNTSGSRNSQEVMQADTSELPSVLTYDYHIRHAAEFLSQHGMQSGCVIPVTANRLLPGTMVVAGSVGDYPDVTIALAIPMATLQLSR